MKLSTQKMMATMHPAQITWAKSLALVQVLREDIRALEKGNDWGPAWKAKSLAQQEAIALLKQATAALLTFGLDFARLAAKKHGKMITPDIERLYQDDVVNYCHTDILPQWWQSKVIDLIMRVKASDVGL